MEKVMEYVEKYVEWVAIGLGALFMFFMVWTYVFNPPAVVELGGEKLTPGEVDPYTYDHVGKQLENALAGNEKLNITVPTYVQAFKDTMDWKGAPDVKLAGDIFTSQSKDIQLPAAPPTPGVTPAPGTTVVGGGNTNVPPGAVANVKVTVLPQPPAATPAEFKFGRSVVIPPGPNGQPAAPPPPAAPGQPAVVQGIDKDWVTQMFHVSMDELNASFQKAQIPQEFYSTVFLQVEMEREEQMPDGSWGNATIVPPLNPPVLRAQPAPVPFPAAPAPPHAAWDPYLQWAAASTPDIIQPLFYTVEKGDQWQKPGPQPIAANQVFDPNQYLTGEIPATLTPEQRQLVLKARQDAYRQAAEQKRQAAPRTPAAPRGGGGRGGPEMEGPAYAPAPVAPRGPVGRPAAGPYPTVPADIAGMGMEGEMGMGGYAGGMTPQTLPQPGVDYPTGDFSPADPKWTGKTIDVWQHDETVQPEKTYRYRLRYKIKNPVLNSNVTEPPALADQFALVSPWSGWSSEVKIPPMVNFFVATSKSPNGNTVTFHVFKFDRGTTKQESFSVSPGDTIGGVKNGTDFTTKWTVVDFRRDERTDDWQILLVNDDGNLVTRSYKSDAGDALYKGLIDTVKKDKAAEGVAAGNALGTGVPPGIR
jgi:hypothetical protein